MTIERDPDYLKDLVKELCRLPNETEWVEFKENNYDPDKIGEYVSALSNSAALNHKPYAYLVWGIQDKTHILVGTHFSPANHKVGNEPLENWLLHLLNPKIHLCFSSLSIDNCSIVVLEIGKAFKEPVKFKHEEYIRIGSVKKRLKDFPEKERLLWKNFNQTLFENDLAAEYITPEEVIRLLDCNAYFRLLKLPMPTFLEGILDALHQESMIKKGKHGRWDILNLGAILFARNLNNFNQLRRKAVRVIRYPENNRLKTIDEVENNKGYACGFEELMDYIATLIPFNEVIEKTLRKNVPLYPLLAVRELVANALIHQDLTITGAAPMIEIFSDRLEITNPGKPLLEVDRFLDSPPRSRNDSLARFMRRAGICEERGSGIDKVVAETEFYQLPPPLFEVVTDNTRAVLFSYRPLDKMDKKDRVRACYLHACLKYVKHEYMTNTSVRGRFGIQQKNMAIASRIIKEALETGLVCVYGETASKKHKRYVPFWASGIIKNLI